MMPKLLTIIFTILIFSVFNSSLQANNHDRLVSDILAESPPFLSASQILEDIAFYEKLLKENYSRYDILKSEGLDWDELFFYLKEKLTLSNKKILTQNFLKELINTLKVTEDGSFTAEMNLHKRHYQASIEKDYFPSFTTLKLVQQDKKFRFLPSRTYSQIANRWFLNCNNDLFRVFPVVPERKGEKRFVLGLFSIQTYKEMICEIEDGFGQTSQENISLQYYQPVQYNDPNKVEMFNWSPGEVPYIRWMRDGESNSDETGRFFDILSELRKRRVFILDVRGNTTGSLRFIESWLRRLSNNNWKNTIIREKQSRVTLEGLLNHLEYKQIQPGITQNRRKEIDKDKQRTFAHLKYIESQNISYRYVKTFFSFSGDPEAYPWNKKMVVVANRHCGVGCQFLVALAKQQKNSFFLGENTGAFPKESLIPMFQLPNSKIRVSINHRLHLDHNGKLVPPSGYEPDFWLDNPSPLSEIYRLARSDFP